METTWPVWILCLYFAFRAGTAVAQPVRIEFGLIEGVRENGLTVYRGIPYAAPPIHERRWREPEPPQKWQGVRNADVFAPACMQAGVSMPGEKPPAVSEDCLYLNIWSPQRTPGDALLPVIAWIHGGGFTNGSASMPLYWGDQLARKGVVVVTVAYRLGPLGFLAHPELTKESQNGSSGNYGLLDLTAALEWIRENIKAFGGDPTNVTIAGQSSGSIAVSILMASPRSRGLFHRAIGQSGGLFEPVQLAPKYLLRNAEINGRRYAESLGAHSLPQLRALEASSFVGKGAAAVSHPVMESYFLPTTPHAAFAAREQSSVPLLIGFNSQEARSISDVRSVTAANFKSKLEQSFGSLPPALLDAYPYSSDEQARAARLDFERDLRFGWDMWAWARLHAKSARAPVFFYYFTHTPPFPVATIHENWGASHFAELWYVFDHLDQQSWLWSAADRELASRMSSYWVNFAKSGNPNGKDLPAWPAFDIQSGNALHLSKSISVEPLPNTTQLRVFDFVYEELRKSP